MKRTTKYETVGHVSVDAGIIQIGDPCYQKEGFKDHAVWMKYLEDNKILDMEDAVQIPHESGIDSYGKAVVVSSGFGDGVYPVEIKKDIQTGRVKEVRIKFF